MGNDDTAALQPAVVPRLRRIVSFLQVMEREEQLLMVPAWKAHRLVGGRKDVSSLSVARNWRITFRIDRDGDESVDLNYEGYHQGGRDEHVTGDPDESPGPPGELGAERNRRGTRPDSKRRGCLV